MYHKNQAILAFFLFFSSFLITAAHAQQPACAIDDRLCILETIVQTAETIDNTAWKDQTLREVAKTYAFEGEFKKALALITQIKTPDTQALTIRGIGFVLAEQTKSIKEKKSMFNELRIEAEKIEHPPSYAIALTYIAMAQALAGDNEGAWQTAADMKNAALKHKAYAETAEIQAEQGDYKSAKTSIEKIENIAFKNKAYGIVSKILANKDLFTEAYKAAKQITNPYKKAQSLQYILDQHKPRDTIKEQ